MTPVSPNTHLLRPYHIVADREYPQKHTRPVFHHPYRSGEIYVLDMVGHIEQKLEYEISRKCYLYLQERPNGYFHVFGSSLKMVVPSKCWKISHYGSVNIQYAGGCNGDMITQETIRQWFGGNAVQLRELIHTIDDDRQLHKTIRELFFDFDILSIPEIQQTISSYI